MKISLNDIQVARAALSKHIEPTPLLRNPWLSERYGCDVYLKLENMHPIGSFKIRGATYKISKLSKDERARGVIAASAGNHAQGVAWGSRLLGVDALIVMPKTAPLMKVQNTQLLGAKVRLEGDSFDEAVAAAKKISEETGRVFVHAFEDKHVIAGQGTTGLEILDDCPDADYVVCSIGGGGLLAGIAVAMKESGSEAKLIGCQASGAPSMVRSFAEGKAVTIEHANTFADGIAIKAASPELLALLKPRLDRILEADDEQIAAAILMLMEKAKVVAEAAAGVPLAVLDSIQDEIKGKKVVLVIGGGNIDVNVLSRVIDRGLIRAGRRLRVNVLISDKTGSLWRLTELIAKEGASVIQAIHDRSEPSVRIDQTEVNLTLETRGPEHSDRVIEALRKHVLRLELAH